MERRRFLRQVGDETLTDVFAEPCGMILREPDVFVEVEDVDLAPVDVRFLCKRGKHFKLAGAGRDDDVRMTVLLDRVPDVLSAA